MGAERTFQLVKDRFYWPYMRTEVEGYCHACLRCIQRKTLPQKAAPMGHLESQRPMELVCIVFLCVESALSGKENILVVTDHFTRYAQAYPTNDQQACSESFGREVLCPLWSATTNSFRSRERFQKYPDSKAVGSLRYSEI